MRNHRTTGLQISRIEDHGKRTGAGRLQILRQDKIQRFALYGDSACSMEIVFQGISTEADVDASFLVQIKEESCFSKSSSVRGRSAGRKTNCLPTR